MKMTHGLFLQTVLQHSGTFQPDESKRWQDFPNNGNDDNTWQAQTYPWRSQPALFPAIVGGNQQGFVEYLGQENFEAVTTNDISLSITNITGNTTTPTVIQSINHNLETGQVIKITQIPTGTPFATSLNNGIFGIIKIDADNFKIAKYNPSSGVFNDPQLDASAVYIGGGKIAIRDNFLIQSKKFNFIDQGQNIQFNFMDILMDDTDTGEITMNMYVDYNDSQPQNTFPQNDSNNAPDTFFNSIIPTHVTDTKGSSKNWQRIYCNARGAFITLEFTLSNAQLNGSPQEEDVQIDSQVLWMRPCGRQLAVGG